MQANLMIQGTMSGVGKSLLTAGLCRLFANDGFSVSPFKSQNMALNSFVTKDGNEMGRAQAMQAEASFKEPSVLMNPILLKPTNDSQSQVIVNGKALCTLKAKEYFSWRKNLVPLILDSYKKLSEKNELIFIEGAGSPAEINLRENDIVNMGVSRLTNAPVVLVGDIDRGGVFAQLYGTVNLLLPSERKSVKGFIINKFRGDKTLLESGLSELERLTGIPVLGVVPYIHAEFDDEDSLAPRLLENANKHFFPATKKLDIVIIRLPHISNFTDFALLFELDFVRVRYVFSVFDLGSPDAVILPGTKNTISDLRELKKSGLFESILDLEKRGTFIFGICGGFQILGETVCDENGVEGGGFEKGLGLLPIDTVFAVEKTLREVHAVIGKTEFDGYEIHHGNTKIKNPESKKNIKEFCTILLDSGKTEADGCMTKNVAGTYIHGIFENGKVTENFLNFLCARKGLDEKFSVRDWCEIKNERYDFLSRVLRENLDIPKLYSIMGIAEKI